MHQQPVGSAETTRRRRSHAPLLPHRGPQADPDAVAHGQQHQGERQARRDGHRPQGVERARAADEEQDRGNRARARVMLTPDSTLMPPWRPRTTETMANDENRVEGRAQGQRQAVVVGEERERQTDHGVDRPRVQAPVVDRRRLPDAELGRRLS